MALIARVNDIYDGDADVHRISVVTNFEVSTRAAMNRMAARAAIHTGVSQRALVAAAYDELGIDLAWRGVGGSVLPEERFSDAKRIDFNKFTMEEAHAISDILPGYLRDFIELEEYKEPGEYGETTKMLYIWEIPLDLD